MTLLIQEYRKRMSELDVKIDALNTQLIKFKAHFKAHTLHDQLEKQLRERFEKYYKEILIQKDKKIL